MAHIFSAYVLTFLIKWKKVFAVLQFSSNLLVRLLDLFSFEPPLNAGLVVDELALEGGRLRLEHRQVLQLLQELVAVDHLQGASGLIGAVNKKTVLLDQRCSKYST